MTIKNGRPRLVNREAANGSHDVFPEGNPLPEVQASGLLGGGRS
jgi:hypothetical protein